MVLLGSAPLLVQHGLTESLAGRFELIPVTHWAYPEMQTAFGWTLAHYLDLLAGAGMLTGLAKFSAERVRQRGSSPKLQVLNTALLTAQAPLGFPEARRAPEVWGRLVESAVGAHLLNSSTGTTAEVFYWRERGREVDFVVRMGRRVVAIEVKSGASKGSLAGMEAFVRTFHPQQTLLVGGDGLPLEQFFQTPAALLVTG